MLGYLSGMSIAVGPIALEYVAVRTATERVIQSR
jgi:hypothetical protein